MLWRCESILNSLSFLNHTQPRAFCTTDSRPCFIVPQVWYWSDGSNGVSRTITVNGAAVLVLGVSFNSNPSLGHTAAVTSLAVSPSGLVLSGGQDGSVYVWNITGRNPGTPLTWFPVAGGIVSSLVSMPSSPWSSSDSEFAVVAYLDSTLRMWSIHTGALVRVLVSPGAGGVYSLALLRDFTVLGGGQNGGVSLWEPVTGTQYLPSLQVRTVLLSNVLVVAYSSGIAALFAGGWWSSGHARLI